MGIQKRKWQNTKKTKKSDFYRFDGKTLIFDSGEFVFELQNYSDSYREVLDSIGGNEEIKIKDFARLSNKNTVLTVYINECKFKKTNETGTLIEKIVSFINDPDTLTVELVTLIARLLKYQVDFFEMTVHLINNRLILRQDNLIFNVEDINLNIDKYTSAAQLIEQRKYITDLTFLVMIDTIVELLTVFIKDNEFEDGTYRRLIDNSKKISKTLNEAIEEIKKIETEREFQK